jgi:dCTP deaminase
MTVLSAQSIHHRRMLGTGIYHLDIDPYTSSKMIAHGMSYGLTAAGYDIRLGWLRHPRGQNIIEAYALRRGEMILGSSAERLRIPHDVQAIVHDKSSWARMGLALQNTVLEPGWEGFITLEISNHGRLSVALQREMPIAQIVFHKLDEPTSKPYSGKYQNQEAWPQLTVLEGNKT